MLKFAALNSDGSSDEEVDDGRLVQTREAKEGQAFLLYRDALHEMASDRPLEGIKRLRELLNLEYVNEEDSEEHKGGKALPTSLQLKYLTYKNLGEAYFKLDRLKKAAKYFIEATMIDMKDIPTWFKIGDIAIQLLNLQLARNAFEMALSLRQDHWPSVGRLILVLYILGDYSHCVAWCQLALKKDPKFPQAIVIADKIFEEMPSMKEFYPSAYQVFEDALQDCDISVEESSGILEHCEEIKNERRSYQDWLKEEKAEPLRLRKVLTENTWTQLGEVLTVHYDCICKSLNASHLLEPIDLSQVEAADSPIERRKYRFDSSSSEDDEDEENSNSTGQTDSRPGFDYRMGDTGDGDNSQQLSDLAMLIGDGTPTDSLLDDLGISINDSRSQRRKKVFQDFLSNNKRRSARNRQGRKTVDLGINYRELLLPFLPTSIFAEAVVSEGDRGFDDAVHTAHKAHPAEILDLRDSEQTEVQEFIDENKHLPLLDLIFNYLVALSQRDERRWPADLKGVFVGLYERIRHNITKPDDFDEEHKDVGLIMKWAWLELNVCELFLERFLEDNLKADQVSFDERFPLEDFVRTLDYICRQTHRRLFLNDRWMVYSCRALYLEARFFMHLGDIAMARCRLQQLCVVTEQAALLQSDVADPIQCVRIVNLRHNNLVSNRMATDLLEGIHRLRHLEELDARFTERDFEGVVSLIAETFKIDRRVQAKTSVIPRHKQLLMLHQALHELGEMKNVLYWGESSIYECLNQYIRASDHSMKYVWSETTVTFVDDLYAIIEKDSSLLGTLPIEKLSRLAHTLIKIISLQMDLRESVDNMAIPSVLTWNFLYFIIRHEEEKLQPLEKTIESAMPTSLMMLFTAHEYLGKRKWCMRNQGAFVLLCVRSMMAEIVSFRKTLGVHPFEEDLTAGLEQCFYCLYGQDRKGKKSPVQDHNVIPLKLTWDQAKYVFMFYKPPRLPEFDSYKLPGISAEAETLFKRIAALIPTESNPTSCADLMANFIESSSSGPMPQMPEDCPDKELISELFYLLGDYYFKNREFIKASRYYMLDSCVNPNRIDSWAGMGLSRSAQIEQRMNSCEVRGEGPQLLKRSDGAIFCFQKALELDPSNASLWIENGSCAFSVVSFFCRQIKLRKPLELSNDTHAEYKRKRVEYLNISKRCYTEAIRCEAEGTGNDELWLCHYMLSKITHKLGEPLEVYMDHISKSAQNLFLLEARYPKKVIYHNPPHLAIEALEMHYKVHAFAMKFLIKNQQRQISAAELQILDKYLSEACDGHFARHRERLKETSLADNDNDSDGSRTPKRGRPKKDNKEKKNEDQANIQAVRRSSRKRPPSQEELLAILGATKAKPTRSNSQEETDEDIVRQVVDNIVHEVFEGIERERRYKDLSEYDGVLERLINYCLDGFRECIFRFSAHFKSIYHMANFYYRYKRHQDIPLALDYLTAKQSKPPRLCTPGLFAERKPASLFHGVWHIPAEEIDRAGSFATHLYRAAKLTQQVAASLNEHETLIQIGLMLSRTPEMEKKYIRDFDRGIVSRRAFSEGLRILETNFSSLIDQEPPPSEKVLMQSLVNIYRVWQQCVKSGCNVDKVANVFKESYTLFKLGEVDSTPSVVEQAASFCSKYLSREARKEKIAQQEAKQMAKLQQEAASKASVEAAMAAAVAAQQAQAQALKEQFAQQEALQQAIISAAANPIFRMMKQAAEASPQSSKNPSPVKQITPPKAVHDVAHSASQNAPTPRLEAPKEPERPAISPTVSKSMGVFAKMKELTREHEAKKSSLLEGLAADIPINLVVTKKDERPPKPQKRPQSPVTIVLSDSSDEDMHASKKLCSSTSFTPSVIQSVGSAQGKPSKTPDVIDSVMEIDDD